MAQKLILCEVPVGKDILEQSPLAEAISDDYAVVSMSGYSTRDNKHMCLVLLQEPEEETAETVETPAATDGEE